MSFKKGSFYKIKDNYGHIVIACYMGRQEGFECCICHKGNNAYTFNIYGYQNDSLKTAIDNYKNGIYETWGFGKEHLPELMEDLNLAEKDI